MILWRKLRHIVFSRPNERRKGYAKKMFSDCLKICKAYGLETFLFHVTGKRMHKRTLGKRRDIMKV
jgi:predicted acetyltransferase